MPGIKAGPWSFDLRPVSGRLVNVHGDLLSSLQWTPSLSEQQKHLLTQKNKNKRKNGFTFVSFFFMTIQHLFPPRSCGASTEKHRFQTYKFLLELRKEIHQMLRPGVVFQDPRVGQVTQNRSGKNGGESMARAWKGCRDISSPSHIYFSPRVGSFLSVSHTQLVGRRWVGEW